MCDAKHMSCQYKPSSLHVLLFALDLHSINEYVGRDIPCATDEDTSVSVGVSGQCPLPGEEVVTGLGITGIAENYLFNVVMVIALQVLFRVGAYVLLRRFR